MSATNPPPPSSGVKTSLPVPSSWTKDIPPANPQEVPIVLDPSSPEPEAKDESVAPEAKEQSVAPESQDQSVARALDSNRIPQTTDIVADLLNRFGYDPNHNTDNEKFSVAKASLIINNIKEYAQSLPRAAESSALAAPNTGGSTAAPSSGASGEPTAQEPKLPERVKRLNAMVAFDDIPARSTEGQDMIRKMKGTLFEKKYKKATTTDAKALLRKEMAELVIEEAEKKYITKKTETFTDRSLGEYLPFSVIWQKEGKYEEGYLASTVVVTAAPGSGESPYA